MATVVILSILGEPHYYFVNVGQGNRNETKHSREFRGNVGLIEEF